MEKTAKDLDFMQAAKLRDDIKDYRHNTLICSLKI
jgi:excinuclease UvrABC helicase subunit UvrB